MVPRWIATLLIALAAAAGYAPAQPVEGRRKAIPDERPDRRAVPRAAPQEEPPADAGTKPRISDLTHPMRAKRVGKPAKADEPAAATESLLRMVPGLGGDALAGLSRSETELSPDVRMLIQFSRMPGSQARRRAAVALAQRQSRFFNTNTRGAPTWSERAQRDGAGRITSMRDAAGNRTRFRYDEQGMVRMDAEPVGPTNPKLGARAGSMRNPQRGGLGTRPIFDYKSFAYRGTSGARLHNTPLSHFTVSRFDDRTGGRSYTTHDVQGRPTIRVDSKGKISLNRYDSMGRMIGTYDGSGRLTITNHDELGRPNFGVDPFGNRAMLDGNRSGGMVLGTAQGSIFKAGGAFGQMNPGAPMLHGNPGPTLPAAPTGSPGYSPPNYRSPNYRPPGLPQPSVPQPGGVPVPAQLPPPHLGPPPPATPEKSVPKK
jgi:hypothetical protein